MKRIGEFMLLGGELGGGVGVGLGVGVGGGGVGLGRLTRPILFAEFSVNQRLPWGPAVMSKGTLELVGTGNSVMVPLVVIRPILFPAGLVCSVNQRLPSGPAVMPPGKQVSPQFVGRGNSVMVPAVVMRPMLFPEFSVNQGLRAGPLVMPA